MRYKVVELPKEGWAINDTLKDIIVVRISIELPESDRIINEFCTILNVDARWW